MEAKITRFDAATNEISIRTGGLDYRGRTTDHGKTIILEKFEDYGNQKGENLKTPRTIKGTGLPQELEYLIQP